MERETGGWREREWDGERETVGWRERQWDGERRESFVLLDIRLSCAVQLYLHHVINDNTVFQT